MTLSHRILNKCHIMRLQDLFGLLRHDPTHLGTFTKAKKQTFCCLCLKFGSMRIVYLCICDVSKRVHVVKSRLPPTPSLLECYVLNRICKASSLRVQSIDHRFHLKVQIQVFSMQYAPRRLYSGLISTLSNSILLRRVKC